MSKRSCLLAAAAVLGGIVLLVCIGDAALVGYSYYQTSVAVRSVNRIAYMDNNLNIQVVDAQGNHHIALTTDADAIQRGYLYPTWSPDSLSLAFLGVSGDENSREAALTVVAATGGITKTVFKSDTDLPFYLYWSPDSQRIGFLTQAEQEMKFMVGPADGGETPRQLRTGGPLYWSWSPDSKNVLLHAGGTSHDSPTATVALLPWKQGADTQQLSDKPGAFQAPAFSPDGSTVLYAVSGPDHDTLYRANTRGAAPQAVFDYTGTVAFAWSPDGKKIASVVTPDDADLPVEGPVFIADADGKNGKQLTTDKVMSFYWSPDSRQIAYITLAAPGQSSSCSDCVHLAVRGQSAFLKQTVRSGHSGALGLPTPQTQTPHLHLQVLSVADGKSRLLATFTPTENFISVIPFFDQYARSLTFWSPDSKHLVYAQAESDTDGSIWVADLDGAAQPHRVGDGTMAVWSWK